MTEHLSWAAEAPVSNRSKPIHLREIRSEWRRGPGCHGGMGGSGAGYKTLCGAKALPIAATEGETRIKCPDCLRIARRLKPSEVTAA